MAEKSGFEQVGVLFADQFEPDGDSFLYRHNGRAAPIRVTSGERERFVADFNRRSKFMRWGLFIGIVGLTLLLAIYSSERGVDGRSYATYAVLGFVFILYLILHRWVWNFPARELRERLPVGEQRSRAEMRQWMLEKTSYAALATLCGTYVVIAVSRVNFRADLISGHNAFWLLSAAAIVVLSAIQALRKWRFDSEKNKKKH